MKKESDVDVCSTSDSRLRTSDFDKRLQPIQPPIPYRSNFLHPLLELVERLGRQGVAFLAPLLVHGDQPGAFEDMKVLEEALPCDGILLRELRGGSGAVR